MSWLKLIDPCNGAPYYVNPVEDKCVWGIAPQLLLAGYEQTFDKKAECFQFTNVESGQVTRNPPVAEYPGVGTAAITKNSARGVSPSPRGDRKQTAAAASSSSATPSSSVATPSTLTLSDNATQKNAMANANPELALDGFAKTSFTKGTFKADKGLRFTTKLTSPMIQAVKDSSLSKEAVSMFKNILAFQGEKNSKKPIEEVAHNVLMLCSGLPVMRDELFVQLVRQTCANPKPQSVEKAYTLFGLAASLFKPTSTLMPFIEKYLNERMLVDTKDPTAKMAAYCLRRLRTTAKHGPRGEFKSVPEIAAFIQTELFQPYMFQTTIEAIMQQQAVDFPPSEYPMPVIIPKAIDAIKATGGEHTEGIFRIPGDVDIINIMRFQIESGQLDKLVSNNPRDYCSLLSLWLRQLASPVIPDKFYDACLDLSEKGAQYCVAALDQLPPPNKASVVAIVKFLQLVAAQHETTKMSAQNLALVFAPNFLRCSSNNPSIILENSKKEMKFVEYLMEQL